MIRLTCLCQHQNNASGKYGTWRVVCEKCGLENEYSNDYGYSYTRRIGDYELHHDDWSIDVVYICYVHDHNSRNHFSDDFSILTRTDLTEQKIKTMLLLK